jgi:hypothetical protein
MSIGDVQSYSNKYSFTLYVQFIDHAISEMSIGKNKIEEINKLKIKNKKTRKLNQVNRYDMLVKFT